MSAGTSFPAVWFLPAVTPLTRRLLVYFDSGAYKEVLLIWVERPAVAVIMFEI
jgi:hypothetical protein